MRAGHSADNTLEAAEFGQCPSRPRIIDSRARRTDHLLKLIEDQKVDYLRVLNGQKVRKTRTSLDKKRDKNIKQAQHNLTSGKLSLRQFLHLFNDEYEEQQYRIDLLTSEDDSTLAAYNDAENGLEFPYDEHISEDVNSLRETEKVVCLNSEMSNVNLKNASVVLKRIDMKDQKEKQCNGKRRKVSQRKCN